MKFSISWRIGSRTFTDPGEYSRHRIAIEEFVMTARELNLTEEEIIAILKDEYALLDEIES